MYLVKTHVSLWNCHCSLKSRSTRTRSLPERWPCWTKSPRLRRWGVSWRLSAHSCFMPMIISVSSSSLVKVLMKNKPLLHFPKGATRTLLLAARAFRVRPSNSSRRMWSVRLLRRTLAELALNWPCWRKGTKGEMKRQRAKHQLCPEKCGSLLKWSPSLQRPRTRCPHTLHPKPLQKKHWWALVCHLP